MPEQLFSIIMHKAYKCVGIRPIDGCSLGVTLID